MARGRRVFRQGRPVRETVWIGLTETRTVAVGANTATLILSLNAAALALRPFTITRSILHWSVRSDQTAASESWTAGLGIAVVSDQASAVGITAVPSPFTDLASDLWLLHDVIDGRFEFVSGVGFDSNGVSPEGGKTQESKAMRKVEDGQDVVVVLENDSLSLGTQTYVVGRMLVKLH